MTEHNIEKTNQIGRIQSFNSRGFGFILSFQDNVERFFHVSELQLSSEKTERLRLKRYEVVCFDVSERDGKPVAVNVRPPTGFSFSFDKTKGVRIQASEITNPTVEDGVDYIGVVSNWNREKKFGSIVVQTGTFAGVEIFVHLSEIKVEGYKSLKPFEAVSCQVGQMAEGPHSGKLVCTDVKPISGLMLACQKNAERSNDKQE